MTRLLASPLFRLALLAAALLLLPLLALGLSGHDWPEARMIVGHKTRPLLLAALLLAVFGLVLDTLTRLRSGNSLLRNQRSYLLWCAVAGAGSAMLLAWLNQFASSWVSPAISATEMLWMAALAGGVMLPSILITRLWLAGFNGLSRSCSQLPALPAVNAEPAAALLLLAALVGLFAGTTWPLRMFWLLWLSPLLLLAALQLLWHESTVFAGLKQGDWSRVLLGALAGILVATLMLSMFRLYGGALYIRHGTLFTLFVFAAYGLLCLQLADIVAEFWRGTTLLQKYQKKPFPIQIVTRKD